MTGPRYATLLVIALLSVCIVPGLQADWLYYDTLSGSEVTGYGGWSAGVSFFYGVSYTNYWTYEYRLTVPNKELSGLSIELSALFGPESLLSPVTGSFGTYEFVTLVPGESGKSTIGLPGALTGIRLTDPQGSYPSGGPYTYSVTMTTPVAPVWADFYIKDGVAGETGTYAYNTGFVSGPLDPPIGPQNLWPDASPGRILAPDSTSWNETTNPGVPEPSSLALLPMVFAGIVFWRRKRGA